jgi:hypothetical protein
MLFLMERQKWWPIKIYMVDHSRDQTLPSPNGSPSTGRLDPSTAREMLKTDFEQAFIVHNNYKDSERDLFKLSLKILAFPGVIAGALLSAKLISSSANLSEVLQIPLIWFALMASGILDTIVVRAYVVTDRVQTEAKHQVNRLRTLYLHALADEFPPGWAPPSLGLNKSLSGDEGKIQGRRRNSNGPRCAQRPLSGSWR